jgi:hypothetical protein
VFQQNFFYRIVGYAQPAKVFFTHPFNNVYLTDSEPRRAAYY